MKEGVEIDVKGVDHSGDVTIVFVVIIAVTARVLKLFISHFYVDKANPQTTLPNLMLLSPPK